jgi:hypothetical protein
MPLPVVQSTRNWNHKHLNISFNGAAITDLNGDATITSDSDLWEFVEGQNGYVERNLIENHLATVTLPIHATSAQLDIFALADVADRKTGAGPFPFAIVDSDRNYKLLGTATVMSIAKPTRTKTAPARNVTLKVVIEAEYSGA